MKVVIAGVGEIGWYIAEQVSGAGHDVTVIELDRDRVRQITAQLDVQVLCGTAASAAKLTLAGVGQADLFVAVSSNDETNLVCASLARKLGVGRALARVDEVLYRKSPEISYSRHFGIDELVSPEMLAALELASMVRSRGAIAVEHFAGGTLEMQRVIVGSGSKLINKPLHEIELPAEVRVASIKRDNTFIIPKGSDHIAPGDQVTIIGKTEQVADTRKDLEADKETITKVVIMGGGHTTLSLARRLRSRSFRLTIIERKQERCELLASILPQATILHGDGTNLAFLKEERIDNADVFISTSASDEANIMSAIQAKDLGVKTVLVTIHRPDYADLVEKMGIDRAVSPRVVMAREVLSLLTKDKVSKLATLDDGKAEILQLTVEGEDFVGQSLRKLTMPEGTLVLTLQRGLDVIVPNADTEFQLDDTVLVICRSKQRKKIIRLIVGRPGTLKHL